MFTYFFLLLLPHYRHYDDFVSGRRCYCKPSYLHNRYFLQYYNHLLWDRDSHWEMEGISGTSFVRVEMSTACSAGNHFWQSHQTHRTESVRQMEQFLLLYCSNRRCPFRRQKVSQDFVHTLLLDQIQLDLSDWECLLLRMVCPPWPVEDWQAWFGKRSPAHSRTTPAFWSCSHSLY